MSKTPARRFARILLATDGSPSSQKAYGLAVTIAKAYESEVVVLSAIPSVSALAAPLEGSYYALQVEKAKEVVDSAASTMRSHGVSVAATDTPKGLASTVETIVEYASGAHADLIVMGTRGLGGLKRALLGSTASGVASAASCATLVARARAKESETAGDIRRIMAAIDGSENARRALASSVDLAKHLKAELEIVHVARVSGVLWASGMPGSAVPLEQMEDDIERSAGEIVLAAAKFAEEAGLPKPKTYVLTEVGSPAQGITDLAEREGADMIVTGTRGLGGLRKMLLGSVANGILHYAPCSVLVVK